MSVASRIFDFPSSKAEPRDTPAKRQGDTKPEKKIMVLDMGEASREEGFRLNGCR